MTNRARGEVEVELAGKRRRVCLTLGALAEIEAGLGVEGFAEAAERLRRLSAADLMVVLAAVLRGSGETDLASRLGEAKVSATAAALAVAAAFEAAV